MRLALCALLSSAAAVLAQTPTTPVATATPHVANVLAAQIQVLNSIGLATCPIGMTAQREASGQREWIVSLEDARGVATAYRDRRDLAGVHVELNAVEDMPLKQVTVAVYYLAPGLRMLPAGEFGTPSSNAPELKKTFVLSAAGAESASRLAGSLQVGRATTITHVRLLSVTFADDTTWHPPAKECNVAPSVLLMVAGNR